MGARGTVNPTAMTPKSQRTRARRRRLQAQGLCIVCGRPRRPGNKNYCQVHRDYHLQYQKAHSDRAAAYARARARHLADRQAHPHTCQWCLQPIDPERWPLRRKYHPACRTARDRALAAHPVNPASHRKAVRAWQARKRAAGCCASCGKPRGPDGTTSLCRACADTRRLRDTQRRTGAPRPRSGAGGSRASGGA
ncbi:MAG TPA: hypothetical protein VMG58_10600 [Candidatus Sulfotelmatobacter sp.]|nr:hypothetical protein [Candidatus Sulfotelmatobacter sp.]